MITWYDGSEYLEKNSQISPNHHLRWDHLFLDRFVQKREYLGIPGYTIYIRLCIHISNYILYIYIFIRWWQFKWETKHRLLGLAAKMGMRSQADILGYDPAENRTFCLPLMDGTSNPWGSSFYSWVVRCMINFSCMFNFLFVPLVDKYVQDKLKSLVWIVSWWDSHVQSIPKPYVGWLKHVTLTLCLGWRNAFLLQIPS